jgi:hypothetical protein
MSKVIVRIKGGLGNQLFCYAAARRLALANYSELIIDDVTGFARDRRYSRQYMLDHFAIKARKAKATERLEPFERYRRGIMKWLSRRKPFSKRRYLEQELRDFDPRLLEFKVNGMIYLDGYWQSEDYFKDVEPTLRQDLRLLAPEDAVNREMAEKIGACNSVAVHVRWFDAAGGNSGNCHNLGQSYYISAFKEIQARVANPHFFIFSDDTKAVRSILPLPEDMMTQVDHNRNSESAYKDLWLMSRCKNFIIANSTFSWWGAWLADNASKVVIAPSIHLDGEGAWGFRGLIPEKWKSIEMSHRS